MKTISELQGKVKASIERLKAFEPEEGYYLAFSGGKNSVVCKALLDMSGCKYDATYRVTSVDPPELVRFIKEKHPDVKREVPRYDNGKPITMWNLIPKKLMPPTRRGRYCCQYLKESGGDGRMTITGVRWAESYARKNNQGIATLMSKKARNELQGEGFLETKRGGVILVNDNEENRRLVESCYKRHRTTLNPIIDWEDDEVWEFIKSNGISYCSLYDEGFKRIGCIGCPLAYKKEREREFIRYPKYKTAYLLAFGKMMEERERRNCDNSKKWQNARPIDIFNWWIESGVLNGQYNLFEDYEDEED